MSFLVYLLHVTIALVIFYSFYLLFLQKETTFETSRSYLIGSILAALVIPLVRIYIGSGNELPVDIPSYIFVGSYLETTAYAEPTTNSFSWIDAAMMVYGAGVVLALSRLIIDFQNIIAIRKSGKVHFFNGMTYVTSEKVKCPYSFFNTIYLPTDHGFTEEELAEVIKHEHAHIAGKHSFDIIFMEVITAFLWLSPVIYLYRAKLRELHEFLADAVVIRTSPWDEYAELLIAQKGRGLQNRLSNQLVYSQLKKRIIMMTQKPSSAWSKMRYFGFLPLIVVGIIILSFRQKDDVHVIATSALQTLHIDDTSSNKIYDLYKDGLKVYTSFDGPFFPGCEKADSVEMQSCSQKKMFDFIKKELSYPSALKAAQIEGKVIVKFVVAANGLITKTWIESSLHPVADQAALDLVNSMNTKAGRWTPLMKEGKPVDMEMVLPVSFKLGTAEDEDVYIYVEQMPSFPGTTEDMYKYIYTSIRYPEEDRIQGNSGQVIVQFVVLPDGSITNVNIVRSVSPGMDAEVVRIIEGMNQLPERWTPGRKNGIPVAVKFTLPVKFVLQAEQQGNRIQPLRLIVSEELKYYVNSIEVSAAMLEGTLKDAVKRNQDHTVILQIADNLTVQDLVDVMRVAEKLNLRMVLDTETRNGLGEQMKIDTTAVKSNVVVTALSKDKSDPTENVVIYPNPTTGKLSVKLFDGAHTIQIIDRAGRIIMTKRISKNQESIEIDTQEFTEGYYVLQVVSEHTVKTMNFIKAN